MAELSSGNPQCTAELIAEGTLGLFLRRDKFFRIPTPETINVTNYRDSIHQTLETAMSRLLQNKTVSGTQEIADRVAQAAEYLADGCCLMTYMKERLAAAEKDVLVSMVKIAQQRRMEGSKGVWRSRSQFLEKVLDWHSNREAVFELIKNSATDREKLVRLTYEHPDYSSSYSFKSYDEDWVVTSMGDMSKSNAILAVDCEMLNVKMEQSRTEITGITAQDLEGVTCSIMDVQKSLENLLCNGTILIGHSLDCDLKALKLDHGRVIDTSLVFRRADGAAMKLVKNVLEKGYDEAMKVFSDYLSKQLFLYRIPVYLSEEELRVIVRMDSAVVLKLRYQQRAKSYSATALFKDQDEANYTFRSIKSEEVKDTNGLQQKVIPVQPKDKKCASGCIHVRKMVRDDESLVPDYSLRKRQIKEAVAPSNEELQKNSDCLKRGKIIQLLQEQLQYCKNNSKY
ncbi:small RNA degrading nuclease 3-like [Papaver somniferum]|uniref:small RNA degrading nuclease 3-like n=1 Tax=Papaver somniferum TaxID=3469 RepID=UPI000E6FAB7D|nr:small RNA degrading nuclease 3-like [Papaver somniferum]